MVAVFWCRLNQLVYLGIKYPVVLPVSVHVLTVVAKHSTLRLKWTQQMFLSDEQEDANAESPGIFLINL